MFSIISVILCSSSSAFFGQPFDSFIWEIRLDKVEGILADVEVGGFGSNYKLRKFEGFRDLDGPRVCLDFRAFFNLDRQSKFD